MADADERTGAEAYPPPRVYAANGEEMETDVHAWFGLSYANYLVLPRSVLQSMPRDWQHHFTALMDELHDEFDYLNWPRYDVRALAREQEHIDSETCTTCDGTGDVLEGGLPVDSEHGCEDCGGHGFVDADRWETPEEVGIIEDPIPYYDRGRVKLTPASEGGCKDGSS